MFKRYIPAFLIITSMLFVAPVAAEMNPESGDKMSVDQLQLITGYLVSDQFLASRLKLRKLDKDPVPELISIATDAKKKPYVRERAFKCMSLFRDKRSKATFQEVLKQKPDRYFSTIVMSYFEAFGEDAVKDVLPHLKSNNADVRLTVVKALGIFGGQPGFDILQAHDKKEQNPQVLSQLRIYVSP